MEEVSLQIDSSYMDKAGTVVMDIETMSQPSDRCLGSPKKITRGLSRKWSYRTEKFSTNEDEEEDDISITRSLVRANSQVEHMKQPLMNSKAPVSATDGSAIMNATSTSLDSREYGKTKRLNRFTTSINPRRILLFFATLSSMGTLLLIYFTLQIKKSPTS